MLFEAFGWRFLFKFWRFPLRFDAFGGFTYLSSLVFKLSKTFQESVHIFFRKSLIQKY